MDDQIVLLEPGDFAVLPRHGAAGEDQAARLLLVGQGEFGIAFHRHLALDEVRLAGAAIARLAAERIANPASRAAFEMVAPVGTSMVRSAGAMRTLKLMKGRGPEFVCSPNNRGLPLRLWGVHLP